MVRSDGTLGYPARIELLVLAVAGAVLAGPDPLTLLSLLSYLSMGVLLAIRRPNTVVSWLLIAIGLSFVATTTQPGVDVDALLAGTGSLRDELVTWMGVWGGLASFVLYAALAAVFPTGNLPAGRWGKALKIALTLGGLVTILAAVGPTMQAYREDTTVIVPNPFGLVPPSPIMELAEPAALLVAIVAFALGVVSLIARYRSSSDVARLQIRWLLAAISVVFLGIMFGIILSAIAGEQLGGLVWLPVILAYPTVPVAIGVAIFRYRLYEIDRIVNRALVYGVVTAILAGVFAGATALTQRVFIVLTGESSDASIVLTTLAVATAYTPVRKRVETFADRYFKYDQRRFGAYRDEIDRLLDLVDPVQAARRLARETVTETRAVGAAVTDRDGRVLASAGDWPSEPAATVPIQTADAPLGSIVVGPRRDGHPHDSAVLAQLGDLAERVSAAVSGRPVVERWNVGERVVDSQAARGEGLEGEMDASELADQPQPTDALV